MKREHGLNEKEMELVKLLMADCHNTGDIQSMLKRLFAGTIEQMHEMIPDLRQVIDELYRSCFLKLHKNI